MTRRDTKSKSRKSKKKNILRKASALSDTISEDIDTEVSEVDASYSGRGDGGG